MQIIKLVLMVITSLIFVHPASAQQKIVYGSNPAAGKYASIRGFKMYYEIYGKGEPVLFIHGNGGSIKAFENQVPEFAKHYRVILADSRAQGRSADPTDSLTYEMMADDLDALLDVLHVKQTYVVGWSDGGINGLLLAMRHPDKVKKLATTGANLWPDSTALDPEVYKDLLKGPKHLLDSMKKVGATPELKNAYKVDHMMLIEPNIKLEQLHKITCPVLVIGGDHDAIATKHTVAIAGAVPKSYLWIIPNSGHATPVKKKDQFNKIVMDFFREPFREIKGTDRYN